MIGSIFSSIINGIKSIFTGYQEIHKAKIEVKKAELENTARLLRDRENNNHAWEMAQLTDKDKILRRLSYLMFALPFFIALFAPHRVNDYFETALRSVPEWWTKTFMAINGAVWGLSAFCKGVLPNIKDFLSRNK